MFGRECALRVGMLVAVVSLFEWSTASPASAAPNDRVNWSACFQEFGPFECGTVGVPLDYDAPNGAQISIALLRLPAARPELRQGSLFINPGGPGGSGVEFALNAPFMFTQEVRDRFDIVGFDPRGTFRSKMLRCFGNQKQWAPYFTPFAFPVTAEEVDAWIAADVYVGDACAQRGGDIIQHMSTANVARDMDRLREAVGDEQLTYYGVSYGSMLGQTYANMFPARFRALVIDGVLDPIAWTTGAAGEEHLPFSTRLRSDVGAQETLQEFFRLCDAGNEACRLSGGAEMRYAALAQKLLAAPIQIQNPTTGVTVDYTYSILIGDTLRALYNSFSWPRFASFLSMLESQASSGELGRALAAFRGDERPSRTVTGYITPRGFPHYPNFIEGFPGVACADSINPDTYEAWVSAAEAADSLNGYFGRIWTWTSSICANWPGQDSGRYLGPFDTPTANPVLVVGARWDPATRYEGAVMVRNLLPKSALLTVNSWGHTSLFTSACADRVIAAYLITGAAMDEVCDQDLTPWKDF